MREYASRLGSVHHLLSDLTLPLLSLFSGDGFDELVQEALSFGPQARFPTPPPPPLPPPPHLCPRIGSSAKLRWDYGFM